MRARNLKPEFFNDKKIGKLGPMIANVYQALWCMADDGGTALCNPEIVKGQMFMYWPAVGLPEITDALEQLATAKRISRYSVGDNEYAIILTFDKHQSVHNPSQFRHPRPVQVVTDTKTQGLQQGSGSPTADVGSTHILTSSNPKVLTSYSAEFDELWKLYPRRSGGNSKDEAFVGYKARLRSGATHQEMIEGVRRYRVFCDATEKTGTEYVKQARTFLGKSRHYLEAWETSSAPTGKYSPELLAHSEWMFTVITEGGFTQPASWESLESRAARRTDIPDLERFLKELRLLQPMLKDLREANKFTRDKLIARIAAAIAPIQPKAAA